MAARRLMENTNSSEKIPSSLNILAILIIK